MQKFGYHIQNIRVPRTAIDPLTTRSENEEQR